MRHVKKKQIACYVIAVVLWPCIASQHGGLNVEVFVAGPCQRSDDDVVKYGIPYHQCNDMCKGRNDCRATSFWPRMAICRLHVSTSGINHTEGFCVYSTKESYEEAGVAECGVNACPDGTSCLVQCGRNVCLEKDCPAPEPMDNVEILGSRTTVGSKLMYRCTDDTLKTANSFSTRTCGQDGWSTFEAVCNEYLVSGPNGIPDDQLSASSVWDFNQPQTPESYFSPRYSRLNTKYTGTDGTGAWSAFHSNTQQYIQAKFNSRKTLVAVAVRGRDNPAASNYVTRFKVLYSSSTSCQSQTFSPVLDQAGNEKEFDGNTDADTIVVRHLPTEVTARCVRINPTAWAGHISMRFDVIGRNS